MQNAKWQVLTPEHTYNEKLRHLADFEFCGNNYSDVKRNVRGFTILYYEFEPDVVMAFGYHLKHGRAVVMGFLANKFDINILRDGLFLLFNSGAELIYIHKKYGFDKIFDILINSIDGTIIKFKDSEMFQIENV